MNPKQAVKLGAYIRKHRERTSLSTRQLGELAGIDQAQVVRLENGQVASPKVESLARIAEAVGVPTAELFRLAGVTSLSELPGLRPYMRAKFDELPAAALDEIEQLVERLHREHGGLGPAAGQDED